MFIASSFAARMVRVDVDEVDAHFTASNDSDVNASSPDMTFTRSGIKSKNVNMEDDGHGYFSRGYSMNTTGQSVLDLSGVVSHDVEALDDLGAKSDSDLIQELQLQMHGVDCKKGSIVIMGAGPVGLYLANRLIEIECNVKVLEPGSYNKRDQVLLLNEPTYRKILSVLSSDYQTHLRAQRSFTSTLTSEIHRPIFGNASLENPRQFTIPTHFLVELLLRNLGERQGTVLGPYMSKRRYGQADVIFTNHGPSWVDHNGNVGFFRAEWDNRHASQSEIEHGSSAELQGLRVEVICDGAWHKATILEKRKYVAMGQVEPHPCYFVQRDVDANHGSRSLRDRCYKLDMIREIDGSEEKKRFEGMKNIFKSEGCARHEDELKEERFAACYKQCFHNNWGDEMTREQVATFFRFFGIKPGKGFKLADWVHLEQSMLIPGKGMPNSNCPHSYMRQDRQHDAADRPRVVVCADGANGGCSTMVLSGTKQQPIQEEFQFESYGMLFLLQNVPHELRKISKDGNLEIPIYPAAQNRFRIFPSRNGAWYLAATLSRQEYYSFRAFCVESGGCPGIDEMWGRQDVSMSKIKSIGGEVSDWLHQLFYNLLNFAAIPKEHHEQLLQGAFVSAFPIILKQAKEFMRYTSNEFQLRAVVGDAAASAHFFSGSGLDIGLKSAELFYELFILKNKHLDPHYRYDILHSVMQQALSFKMGLNPYHRFRRFPQVEHARQTLGIARLEQHFVSADIVQFYREIYNSIILHDHVVASYNVIRQPNSPPMDQEITYGSFCDSPLEYLLTLGIGDDHRPSKHASWLVCPSSLKDAVKALSIRLEFEATERKFATLNDEKQYAKKACGRSDIKHKKKIATIYPNLVDVLDEANAARDRDTICALYEAFDDDLMHLCLPDPFAAKSYAPPKPCRVTH